MTQIDDLVRRFAELPGARVGRGPHHPDHPDIAIEESIANFLAEYPALRRDQGYVDFLMRYAGASAEVSDAWGRVAEIVDILGFTDASTEIELMEGPVVDDDGFLIIAQCIYHVNDGEATVDTQEYDFAFDAGGERGPDVYYTYSASSIPASQRSVPFESTGLGFADWMARLIEAEGRFRSAEQFSITL